KRTISTGNRNCVVRHSKSGPLMTALGQSRQIDIPQPAGNVRFAPKAAVRSPTGAGRVERRESWPGKDVEGEIEPRPGIGERSGLSKPHVRFSREQTLVAPAKLVAFYSRERAAGGAKPPTELFRGKNIFRGCWWRRHQSPRQRRDVRFRRCRHSTAFALSRKVPFTPHRYGRNAVGMSAITPLAIKLLQGREVPLCARKRHMQCGKSRQHLSLA